VLRRSPLAFVAILLALLLAACGSGSQGSQPASSAPTQTRPPAPHRIVSLSPPATESLFAIGAGSQVIAVDDQSNYPAEAPHTKLSSYEPNVEAIAGYEPDLVVASYDPGGLVSGLQKLHIRVLMQQAPKNLDGAYDQITELGKVTGHVAAAQRLVSEMKSKIAGYQQAASGTSGLSVYHEISPDFYSATSKTFIGSVYKLFGAKNIADDAGGKAPDYPQLSAEYIVSADPDVIVLSDTKCCGQSAKTVRARPGWSKLNAVQNGNVVGVDDDIASRWGPRIVDFARVVSEALAKAEGS
jgi:iron complex transport system substrate-binding protein